VNDSSVRGLVRDRLGSLSVGLIASLLASIIAHLFAGLIITTLACIAALITAEAIIMWKHRQPLSVNLQSSQWDNLSDVNRMVAAEFEISNRTSRPIRIESYEFGYERADGLLESAQISESEALAIDSIAKRYYPPLDGFVEVPARRSICGWYVAPVSRNPAGGTPKCILTVKDYIGNLYYAIIPAQQPHIYPG
jgi:hypothetical protein